MKIKGLVALATAMLAFTVTASEFLEVLAMRDNRVNRGPCSEGGDVILKDGNYYIHVFTNPATSSKFVLSKGVDADLLVVGGGGGGGFCGGGGGAGGYVSLNHVALGAGTYQVMVGAGGAWPEEYIDEPVSGQIYRDNGGHFSTVIYKRYAGLPSWILSDAGYYVAEALGGGGGGSHDGSVNSGMDGGSGGGTYLNSGTPGKGTPGQGNDGGLGVSNCGGGGGGAGAPAGGRNGGDGLENEILGFFQYFAGGGGGGPHPDVGGGQAGKGGGGAGASKYRVTTPSRDAVGKSGMDGLGGGGGGGGGQPGNAYGYVPGDGGSGIVIIRYDGSSMEAPEPIVGIANLQTDPEKAQMIGNANVASCGAGYGVCSVYLKWGYFPSLRDHDPANLEFDELILSSCKAGIHEFILPQLLPNRTYYAALYAINDGAVTSAVSRVLTFTMPADSAIPEEFRPEQPVIDETRLEILDSTGEGKVFVNGVLRQSGRGCEKSSCIATVRWAEVNDSELFVNASSATVRQDGSFTVEVANVPFARCYGVLEVQNPRGFLDRYPIEFDATDTTDYTWSGAAGDGMWNNPENWTGKSTSQNIGYPTDFSGVIFPAGTVAEVTTTRRSHKAREISVENDAEVHLYGFRVDLVSNVVVHSRAKLIADEMKITARNIYAGKTSSSERNSSIEFRDSEIVVDGTTGLFASVAGSRIRLTDTSLDGKLGSSTGENVEITLDGKSVWTSGNAYTPGRGRLHCGPGVVIDFTVSVLEKEDAAVRFDGTAGGCSKLLMNGLEEQIVLESGALITNVADIGVAASVDGSQVIIDNGKLATVLANDGAVRVQAMSIESKNNQWVYTVGNNPCGDSAFVFRGDSPSLAVGGRIYIGNSDTNRFVNGEEQTSFDEDVSALRYELPRHSYLAAPLRLNNSDRQYNVFRANARIELDLSQTRGHCYYPLIDMGAGINSSLVGYTNDVKFLSMLNSRVRAYRTLNSGAKEYCDGRVKLIYADDKDSRQKRLDLKRNTLYVEVQSEPGFSVHIR